MNQTVGIAGLALTLAEQQLVAVQKLASKHGPNIKGGGGLTLLLIVALNVIVSEHVK